MSQIPRHYPTKYFFSSNFLFKLVGAFAVLHGVAHACSACQFAMLQYKLPGSWVWAIVAAVWFLVNATIARRYQIKVPLIPSPVNALFWFCVLGVLGAVMFAHLLFLLLLVPCVFPLLRVATRTRMKAWPKNAVRAFVITAMVCLPIILASGIYFKLEAREMTLVDYIVRYPGTSYARLWMREIEQSDANPAEKLKIILRDTKGWGRFNAAERLAAIAPPEVAVPPIIDAWKSFLVPGVASSTYDVKAANETFPKYLRKLTSLDLKEGSTPQDWEAAWAALQDRRSSTSLQRTGQ